MENQSTAGKAFPISDTNFMWTRDFRDLNLEEISTLSTVLMHTQDQRTIKAINARIRKLLKDRK